MTAGPRCGAMKPTSCRCWSRLATAYRPISLHTREVAGSKPAAPMASRDTARAMSEENVEIVRRALEAGFRHPRDWETVDMLVDPDHVFVPLLTRVEGKSAKGVRGFRDWSARMDETGEWYMEVDEVRAAPNGRVLCIARFTLRAE